MPARPRISRQAVPRARARPSAGRRRAERPSSSSARGCRRRGSGRRRSGRRPSAAARGRASVAAARAAGRAGRGTSRRRGSGRARRAARARSSIRARWKNASARSSPSGRSPRSTCSQAASPVRHVVAEAEVVGADRVEHPAGAPLHLRRDQRSAALTTRASCAAPGFGSSSENTGSTYGGRWKAGRSPASSVIAQRPVLALGRHRCRRATEQVVIRDAREVHAERRGQPVPEPEAEGSPP